MKVADIMSGEVVSIGPDASIREAAEVMTRARIGGLPVINSFHVLVGIVTDGDLLRRAEIGSEKRHSGWAGSAATPAAAAKEYVRSHAGKVGDIMTSPVEVAGEEMPVDQAARIMEGRRVKRLPVVRGGRVVGILSRADFVRALAERAAPANAGTSDDGIRKALTAELQHAGLGFQGGFFLVNGGVVDLWGMVGSESERTAIRVAAENVRGVRKVSDHMILQGPRAKSSQTVGVGGRHFTDAGV